MRRRDFIRGIPLAAAAVTAGCSSAQATIPVLAGGPVPAVPPLPPEYARRIRSIPVLAWHQVAGGHATTPAQDVIWNYNRDCSPAAAVCDTPGNDETVSLAQLDAQLGWLKTQGYQSVTAGQYTAWAAGKPVPLPAKPVLLTVDDGTLNSYAGVTAVLARYGFSMVSFIVTEFADGATANVEPYAGWNASWDQLLSLPEAQWSFAFHAGARGHGTYWYPCQSPSESVAAYRGRVAGEIAAGRTVAGARLGARMNDAMWAVPWGDVGDQAGLPATGDGKTWLAPWAATQFPVIFIQDPAHNGYLNERYRLVVQGNWPLEAFAGNFSGNVSGGFFDAT